MLLVISVKTMDEDARALIKDHIVELQDLKVSLGWARLKAAMEKRVDDLRKGLSKIAQTSDIEKVRILQGEIEGLEWAASSPDREIERLSEALTTSAREQRR